MPTFQHPFLSDPYGPFTWCSRCLYVYRTEDWVDNNWRCPNPGCGVPASYACRWEAVMKRHPELPETPESGTQYALFATPDPA